MTAVYLGEIRFPLPPETLTFEQAADHKRVRLIDLGEVTQLALPGQAVFSFEGCFPVTGELLPAEGAAALKAMMGRKSVRFVAAGIANPVSMQVTVEKLRLWEEAGDCGSVFYSLTLREYRSPAVQAAAGAAGTSSGTSAAAREDSRELPAAYTVVKGDSLWAIAKRYLGSGSRYRELAAKNNIANPNLIFPGQVIRL
ncbi:MAG: LysM peptidoglycan-binding domain-containing protein [Oscillospiraceae bacterium]|nr:LysM peptidoglycan-binding domain-containing protein [Oscillospiraceae bacterium]